MVSVEERGLPAIKTLRASGKDPSRHAAINARQRYRSAGAIETLNVRRLAGKQRRSEEDDYREDGDSDHQHQPFQIMVPEEAGKVQDHNYKGDGVKDQR
jgi:hypothetical protein